MTTSPCKGCQNRTPACWSKCELYTIWKKKVDEVREAAEKRFLEDDAFIRARGTLGWNRSRR